MRLHNFTCVGNETIVVSLFKLQTVCLKDAVEIFENMHFKTLLSNKTWPRLHVRLFSKVLDHPSILQSHGTKLPTPAYPQIPAQPRRSLPGRSPINQHKLDIAIESRACKPAFGRDCLSITSFLKLYPLE